MEWCREMWIEHHYLHSAIDPRCRPIAYIVMVNGHFRGALGFGRPESTRCNGWYGSVDDVRAGRAVLTRWEIINLARVWLDPRIQPGGAEAIHNAATQAISQALRRVALDYLISHPPVYLDEPYQLRQCISYCNSATHRGVLYRAANFTLKRTNERGLQTWMRRLRGLMPHEHRAIRAASDRDERARRFRAQRAQATINFEAALA
jgi:hypothetical protein